MTQSLLNNDQIYVLKEAVRDKLQDVFDYFSLDLSENHVRFHGPCPIHGGDKYNAFSVSKQEGKIGNWRCYTHNCHEIFGGDIIGLVKGLLSRFKYNWGKNTDKTISFKDTIDFIIQLTNCQNLSNIHCDPEVKEKKHFIKTVNTVFEQPVVKPTIQISREEVRAKLSIPSPYYLSRGYSQEILDKYDVGFCNDYTKPMYKRSVTPIYDENYEYCIGCTGRSIFEKCPICQSWHNPTQPCPQDKETKQRYCKWKHSYGFIGENSLYNYWFAKKYIQQCKIAIIVESPGNVWRLEEAGINCSVGTFGAHLTPFQKNILDKSGALTLIVLSDPDAAGKLMNESIEKSCSKTYQLYFPKLGTTDIGDMTVDYIQSKLQPIMIDVRNQIEINC